MNIVLIGMRGSGKSTVGKIISKKTDKAFYDLDEIIVQKVGMSIPELIEKYDWEYFRNKESEMVKEISKKPDAVIAPGGGAIIRKENSIAFKKNGKLILLNTPITELIKRIGGGKHRPSLTEEKSFIDEMEDVWNERKSLYERTADFTIETDKKTPDEIADEIIKCL